MIHVLVHFVENLFDCVVVVDGAWELSQMILQVFLFLFPGIESIILLQLIRVHLFIIFVDFLSLIGAD